MIVQLVSHNVHKSSHLLHPFLENHKNIHSSIICVQEIPWGKICNTISSSDPHGTPVIGTSLHPSFVCIHHSFPNNTTPSVATYVHKSLLPSSPTLFTTETIEPSMVVVLLQRSRKEPIYFYNIYNNQNDDVLTWLYNTPDLPTVWALVSDFNLHSPMWDDTST